MTTHRLKLKNSSTETMKKIDGLSFVPALTYSAYSIYCGFSSDIAGCSSFIRAVGHVGVLTSFLILAYHNVHIGHRVHSTFCLFTARFLADFDAISGIFLVTGFYSLSNYSHVRVVAPTVLLLLVFNATFYEGTIDAYALAGHCTLIVSSCQSLAYFMSIVILAIIALDKSQISVTYSLLILYISVDYAVNLRRLMSDSAGYSIWTARTLYDTSFGSAKLLVVFLYSVVLIWQNTLFECSTDHMSIRIHNIHVGGIFAVVVYIFPQVAASTFQYVKATVCAAALTDTCLSVVELWVQHSGAMRYCLYAKIALSALVAISCGTTSPPCETAMCKFFDAPTKERRAISLVLLQVFMIYHVVYSLNFELKECLSHLVHFVFIVGGLAIEAIWHNDALMARLARCLLLFEVSVVVLNGITGTDTPSQCAAESVAIASALLALPFNPSSSKGVLAFDDVDLFVN